MARAKDNAILNLNENDDTPSDTPAQPQSVEDIIARGAAAAVEADNATASDPVTVPEVGTLPGGEKPRRKYTRRKKSDEPELTPEEEQRKRDLDAFFSAAGIGGVFANGIDAFYRSCAAPPVSEEERALLANSFAAWARARMPAESAEYQPELLLGAALAMTTLPRMQPIATKTAPAWRRAFARLKRALTWGPQIV